MSSVARKQTKKAKPELKVISDRTWRNRVKSTLYMHEKAQKRRSIASVGAGRIIALLHEIGNDAGKPYGWKVAAALDIGLSAGVAYNLLNGNTDRVGVRTIDSVCKHLGCPIGVLVDENHSFKE